METASPGSSHPPSAKFILHILDEEGAMSITELAEKTEMPVSTVRVGIEKLVEAGDIEKSPDPNDARSMLCHPTPEDDSPETAERRRLF